MQRTARFRHLEAFYWAGITPGAPESHQAASMTCFQLLRGRDSCVLCPCKAEGCPITECLPSSLCRFIGPGLLPLTEEVKHVIYSTHAGLYALAGLSTELVSVKASQPATTVVHRAGGKCLPSSAASLEANHTDVIGAHCSCSLGAQSSCGLLFAHDDYLLHAAKHAVRLFVTCRRPGCSAVPGCTCNSRCSRLVAWFCRRDP